MRRAIIYSFERLSVYLVELATDRDRNFVVRDIPRGLDGTIRGSMPTQG